MKSLTLTLLKKTLFTMKALLSLFVTLVALTTAMPALAFDQPWNGNREDITGPDNTDEDDDCPEGGCPPEPDCNDTSSPVYTARGYLVYTENDIAFANNVSRVHLKRTYNSFDRRAGLFGRGWVTPQEMNIARTYKAVTEGNEDGSPKTATEFESVPIFLTEYGRRYKLTETETTCTAPGVLYFSFEKLPDGTFKQVFEQDNDTATFSASGLMLSSYSDEAGTYIYYDYDDQSRLIQQRDSDGFALNFSYNAQGFVAQVTDQADRVWTYTYNEFGSLIQQQDPDGNTKDYTYQTIDNIGHQQYLLTNINDNTDDPRLSVTWSEVLLYGKKAQRVESYIEEDGRRHSYTYAQSSVNGLPTVRVTKTTQQVNATAVIETQVFEANRDTYQIVSAVNTTDSTQVAKTYNERSKLISRTDRRGNITEYTYNDAGRITTMIELAGTDVAKTITRSYWNNTDRIAVRNEYDLRETRYTYDTQLRVLTQTRRDMISNQERVWRYTYHPDITDAQGNTRLGQVASIDAPQIGPQDTTTFEYNEQGLLTRINYPLNQSISTTYNAVGQPASQTDFNGIVTLFGYNSRNQLIQTTRNNRTIRYIYNGQNQLTQITDALGRQASFAYDAYNHLSRVTFPSGDYMSNDYEYQANRTEVTARYYQADGTLISTYISYQHPISGLTEQEFIISASNTVSERRYNALDELIEHTRIGDFSGASRATSTYTYDQEGRLSTLNDALNGRIQWSYDALNRVTQILDPNNANTEYRYTAWNELLQIDSPDTGTTTRQLDTAGNITQHVNANNQQTVYRYDEQNRLSEVDYQGDDLDVVFSYDQGTYGQGRLSSVSDGSGSSQYEYDDRGLITQVNATVAGVPLNTAYQYNEADELTQTGYPSGIQVQRTYDDAARLSGIQLVDNITVIAIISNISWHGPALNSYQQGNSIETQWTYDAAGRLIGKQFDNANNQFQQQLDNQGQITQQTWTRDGNPDAENFQYDVLGRLNSYAGADANSNQLLSYDSVGNRLSQQLDSNSTTYGYEANSNRQSTINATTVERDAAGNTLNDGIRQYQYDAMNRFAQMNHSQSGAQAIYTHNYLGQRVRKQRSGDQVSDTRYVYGLQGELLGEYSPTGQRIYEYIYHNANGSYELVAQVNSAGDITYVHTDHLGTPRLATNSDKTVVWRWVSDAFGVGSAQEDPDGDNEVTIINHRFAGQYADQESGLYYNYFRTYDPNTGRYLQSDPTGLSDGPNSYGYVGGSPLNHIDPLGLETTMVCRPVQHWLTNLLGGGVHCSVTVWHWEEGDGMSCSPGDERRKVIDRQYSLANNPEPFPQGTDTFTYNEDIDAFNNPGGVNQHFPISPPVPFSQEGFDNNVIESGDNYSQGPYSNVTGPNSNTAADNIIEGAGGVAPDVPGAFHQNDGEGWW